MTLEQQKILTQKLGQLSGKPESSTLHVHPLFDGPETLPMNDKGDRDPNGNYDSSTISHDTLANIRSLQSMSSRTCRNG